eukprot:65636-Pyramimonas_sp.AAC.1
MMRRRSTASSETAVTGFPRRCRTIPSSSRGSIGLRFSSGTSLGSRTEVLGSGRGGSVEAVVG